MKKKILVVDDDKWLPELIQRFLSFEEYDLRTISEFETINDIIQFAQTEDFDCVLVDYMLVCCTGVELCEQLREMEEFEDLPFLLVTSMAISPQISKKMLELDMHYVKKPFTKEELSKAVLTAMSADDEDIDDSF